MITRNHPRFTVAITVWRRPELLLRALLSLFDQDYAHWRCLVVSDGPAPQAVRLVRQFDEAHGDRRFGQVTFHELERREGLWGNHLRRWALDAAEGDHCVIMGHDCILSPYYLSTHARQIEAQPDALSIVGTHVWSNRVLGAPHRLLTQLEYLGVWPRGDDPKDLKIADLDLLCMALPAPAARRVGCFGRGDQHRYAADYTAYRRLIEAGVAVVMSKAPRAAHF